MDSEAARSGGAEHRPGETSVAEAARSGAAGVSEVVANDQRVAAHRLIARI
jgi:hypothetical protein